MDWEAESGVYRGLLEPHERRDGKSSRDRGREGENKGRGWGTMDVDRRRRGGQGKEREWRGEEDGGKRGRLERGGRGLGEDWEDWGQGAREAGKEGGLKLKERGKRGGLEGSGGEQGEGHSILIMGKHEEVSGPATRKECSVTNAPLFLLEMVERRWFESS